MKPEKYQAIRILKTKKVKTILEMIFTLFILFNGMTYAISIEPSSIMNEEVRGICSFHLCMVFLFLGLSRFFRAWGNRYRTPSREKRWLDCISAAAFLLCIPVILIKSESLWEHEVVCIVYLLTLLVGWVLSVIQDHSFFNVARNIVAAVIVVLMTKDLWDQNLCFIGWSGMMYVVSGAALINIISVVFARIQLKVLQDILRKTYALEIISGLVLLILAFSYLLLWIENDITSYKDALWYCFTLVTTIGFGDFSVVSDVGRIISVVLGIYGIIVVALITSIIVNFYGEVKNNHSEKDNPPDSLSGEEDTENTKQSE